MTGDISGSVQIINVSSQNSGIYRCSVTNLLGTQNCYVNLSVYSREFLVPHTRLSLPSLKVLSLVIHSKGLCAVYVSVYTVCLESQYLSPSPPPAAPDSPPGILQGVLVTLSMALVLLALLVLVLWLHRSGQERKWRDGKEEEEECYNEIRYTPSLMKRSFV